MKQDAGAAAEAVSSIRRLLADWLMASTEAREPVAEILKLLESLDTYIRGELSRPSSRKTVQEGGSGSGAGTTYTIDKKRNQVETLTEHREGGSSQPYRVPRPMYDMTVKALADTDTPMEFEELMQAVSNLRSDPPDWQVRAVLRFSLNAQPPLIVRERNKYRAEHPSKIVGEAKQLWHAIAKGSK